MHPSHDECHKKDILTLGTWKKQANIIQSAPLNIEIIQSESTMNRLSLISIKIGIVKLVLFIHDDMRSTF